MTARVSVMLPLGFAGALDYIVPGDMSLAPGDYVEVPLGKRIEAGVVWGPAQGDVDEAKLKPVAALLPVPAMPEAQRRFIDWVASYTLSGPGAVLRMAMSVPDALQAPRALPVWRIAPGFAPDRSVTPARQKALAAVIAGGALTANEIQDIAEVGAGVVKALAKSGALVPATRPAPVDDAPRPDPDCAAPVLSPAQAAAAQRLREAVTARRYGAILLEGVTGSGKTEVYFEAVAQTLKAGRQALVLLPEIALSAQWFGRFERRFGAPPALWHSDVRGVERRRIWRAVAQGRAPVVVGARSALFLPFADLGLIVVDEEHEGSFKQEEGVIYHARDMAVVRAHLAGIPVVLASATPALETLANVDRGRYGHALLPQRHGGAVLPKVELVDLRRRPPARGRWLSPDLESSVDAALAAGEQAMLFLNRRGYAPLTLCRTCGHRMQCPNCSACLVEHRLAARLQCHHCGYSSTPPSACPSCGTADSFAACGPGVERLAEEAAARFPAARLAVMTSDTIRGPGDAEAIVQAMAERRIDLLIGTQIVAKGHNFPWLTLVGVVDADLGLAGGDPRAAERTWQLLSQVGGRAGRAERPGRVLLQTYMPEHPVLQALAEGDQARFLAEEMAGRREQALPPFGRLAALIVSGPQQAAVERSARELAASAPRRDDLRVLGPAPAPLAVLRGHHRQRLLVKAGRDVALQPILRRWLAQVKTPAAVKIKVDIDPYSFL